MKKFIFLLIIAAITSQVHSQRKANVGIFAGASYYLGDINPNLHFYRPGFSTGLIYRYNFNKFYALRLNAYYGQLSGSDNDFPNLYHPGDRYQSPAAFRTSLLDASAQFEINFFPFLFNITKWDMTPYIAGGLGYSTILMYEDENAQNTGRAKSHLTVPFGVGFKISLSKRLGVGAEWSFRKTGTDLIDGVYNFDDPSSKRSLHNNDWYSFAGIFITYKFFNFAVDCPVYE